MTANLASSERKLSVAIIGSAEFTRYLHTDLYRSSSTISISTGSYEESWHLLTSFRPELLVIEIGPRFDERTYQRVRGFLTQLRSRTESVPYVCIALTASERFFFGGDLLFSEAATDKIDSEAPGLVDTFLVQPPINMPEVPTVSEQLMQLIDILSASQRERIRASLRNPNLGSSTTLAELFPALNTPGWVQSLADTKSRELWLKWLPRYAGYLNESPLIVGQTGTGKTNLALALHILSGRSGKFVSITPRDFSSSELVQAELFGAVSGAYTGAVDKWGLVKSAERGTLFIDELQSIDKDLQGKLITFIENKSYRRVGSSESIAADVRFIFATNRSLSDLLSNEVLRDDFAYRLERVQLQLLPLKERKLDIPAALAFALAKVHRQRPQPEPILGFSSAAYKLLMSHPWPGNLRQLENAVAKLCEHADMQQQGLVEEQAVRELAGSLLMTNPTSRGEVLARAAFDIARFALAAENVSLASCIEQLTERALLNAVDATSGDLQAASQLIGENRELLELVTSRIKE